ncbi:MAG: septum formation initiator family protein [Bacteroidia bacterium]|nr:septum formation initiator family protein [Bacteroidia bacterium]
MLKNQKIQQLISTLKNKYIITLIFLVTWLLFFDRYDFITQYKTVKELKQLEEEKLFYQNEIQKNQNDLLRLRKDPEYLEKFAREKYQMKQDNEDVYLIIDSSKDDSKE